MRWPAISAWCVPIRSTTRVETTELLAHTGAPRGRRLGAITLSGAFRGLLFDAAERNHLQFPKLADATLDKLNSVLGVGSLVGNPIDGGFGVSSSAANYQASIAAMQADPNVDMILIQENLPREAGSDRAERYIATVEAIAAAGPPKPIAFVTPVTHSQSDYSRALRRSSPHVSFLLEANKALRTIESVVRRDELERLAAPPSDPAANRRTAPRQRAQVRALARCRGPDAQRDRTPRICYGPMGLYAGGDRRAIGGRSRDGGAKNRLSGGAQSGVRQAAAQIRRRRGRAAPCERRCGTLGLRAISPTSRVPASERPDAMLVCQQISGGLGLVLGLHRDPEVGIVVMAGSGGVLLELMKDVAFRHRRSAATRPVTCWRAPGRRLLSGYRGAAARDADAVVDALVALGRIAEDLADVIQAVDINPFVVLPRGGFALERAACREPTTLRRADRRLAMPGRWRTLKQWPAHSRNASAAATTL